MKRVKIVLFILGILVCFTILASCAKTRFFETHAISYQHPGALFEIVMAQSRGEYQSECVSTFVIFDNGKAYFSDYYYDTNGDGRDVETFRCSYYVIGDTLTVNGVHYKYTIDGDEISFEPEFYGQKTWEIGDYSDK